MDINLQSVLDRLIREERDEAASLLHTWFVNHCSRINNSLMEDDAVPDEDEEEVDENLSPISGIQTADDDVDDLVLTHDEVPEDEGEESELLPDEEGDDIDSGEEPATGDDVDLEDRVEDLESELADLRSEIKAALGVDDGEVGGEMGGEMDPEAKSPGKFDDDPDSKDEDDVEFNFEDLEEAFELEKVTSPKMNTATYSGTGGKPGAENTKSPLPNLSPEKRFAGKPVEIKSTNYDGMERQPSPTVKTRPLLKNQVKNAESNLEKVDPKGPKSALLNNKGEGFSDTNNDSLMGGKTDLRGKSLRESKPKLKNRARI